MNTINERQFNHKLILMCEAIHVPVNQILLMIPLMRSHIEIKYKNYSLLYALSKRCDEGLMRYLIEEKIVSMKDLGRVVDYLCKIDKADFALVVLNMVIGSISFGDPTRVRSILYQASALGHLELCKKMQERNGGGYNDIQYVLVGAMTGENPMIIDAYLNQFIIHSRSIDAVPEQIEKLSRSFVVYASKVNDVNQFTKVLQALNPLCNWDFSHEAENDYLKYDLDGRSSAKAFVLPVDVTLALRLTPGYSSPMKMPNAIKAIFRNCGKHSSEMMLLAINQIGLVGEVRKCLNKALEINNISVIETVLMILPEDEIRSLLNESAVIMCLARKLRPEMFTESLSKEYALGIFEISRYALEGSMECSFTRSIPYDCDWKIVHRELVQHFSSSGVMISWEHQRDEHFLFIRNY